ncbi:hypothetical protein I6N98_13995 [Spongiibacter nanhainus]|uniref:Uncharacterized protein n=1 Tax=Spongiibacter nanhainus TaxID=2794344 RepID=A0A7T4UPB3_9GAMM|nr:hypothetical protein [Spongiibacter nanhainus]QQD17466.1 hypothetical protein I6N98_13995 [Spongiibacter nanhainus]
MKRYAYNPEPLTKENAAPEAMDVYSALGMDWQPWSSKYKAVKSPPLSEALES